MHVIVVGAGIDGLSTAWSLVKRGVEVTLLEQADTIPNPLSASGDQHRIIRRAYGGLGGYQRRIDEAYDAWAELWDDIGEKLLIDTGFLLLSQTPGDEGDIYHDGLIEAGYPVEELSPSVAETRYPFLDGKTLRRAGFSPEGGVLLCQRMAAAILEWLKLNSATVITNARVEKIDAERGCVHFSGHRSLHADHIVVTAGAWVVGLLPHLADRLTAYRTAVAYLKPPEDLRAAWEKAPVILDVGGTVDGYILPPVSGTGLKVGAGIHKRKSDPDRDRNPAPGEGEQIRDYFSPPLARIAEYGIEEVVTCAYTFTADEHFFVEHENKLIVVSACSGHGYKFGAAVGRRIAAGIVTDKLDEARIWLEARD